jgi:hypothetical protein
MELSSGTDGVEMRRSPFGGPIVAGDGAHLLGIVGRGGINILTEGVKTKFVVGEGATEILQVISGELLVSNVIKKGVVIGVRAPLMRLRGGAIRDEVLQLVDVDNTIIKEMSQGRVARNAFGRESEIVLGGGAKGPDGQDQRIGVFVIR